MTLNDLHQEYCPVKDIRIIGKELVTEKKLCEVMGFCLFGGHLQLLLLEYDKGLVEYEERQEELYSESERVLTNRSRKRRAIDKGFRSAVSGIEEIVIDGISYIVEENGTERVMPSDYEKHFLFAQFFEKGWEPKSIGGINLENCFLSTITFKESFNKIPRLGDNAAIIFRFCDDLRAKLVEQAITLNVGREYKEKIYFIAEDTGEEHWVYINNVSVIDIYTETMKKLEDPQFAKQLSAADLIKMKVDAERRILEVCPRGKGFLAIEYESDRDQQIDFYSKQWLESEPSCKSFGTTFVVRADKKEGILGKRLRAALVEEPLELGTKIVEAEIFSVYETIEGKELAFQYTE